MRAARAVGAVVGASVSRPVGAAALAIALCTGCSSAAQAPVAQEPAAERAPVREAPAVQEPAAQAPAPLPEPSPVAAQVTIPYRVEVRSDDPALQGADAVVEQVLSDPRGWARAGFALVRDDDAPFVVVLAEPDDVDRLCAPYVTSGRWSCQNGPVVALNADRWREASPKWTGDLATYRQMLVNHEVGHLLGQHHPPVAEGQPQCPVPGEPALVMAQQSTELDGCLPNPWPLPGEVERAARHDEPLAPPFER